MCNISEEARNARNKYAREYRKNHPERIAEIQQRYWEKKARQAKSGTSFPAEETNNNK